MLNRLQRNVLYLAWIQALMATLGSLYFSELRHFPPCSLCWYQRIAMYPLVILLAIGIIRKDRGIYLYVLPFSITGGLIAFYQVLLERGILPESTAPCTLGVSCTTQYITYFGFVTIPLLSLAAFVFITLCLLIHRQLSYQGTPVR